MKVQLKREGMVRLRRFYSRTKRRSERTVLISSVVRMTGLSRKYVIRLLNGKRRYRKHKGRRPVYSKEARERLVRIWLAMGQLCPKYLHATMSKALQDDVETYGEVSKPIATERLRMSASTMERILLLYRFNHETNFQQSIQDLSQSVVILLNLIA